MKLWYRILDSVNHELAAYSVRLFETRFSLSVEASSAALPTGDWLTSRCSCAFPPELLQVWPCVLPVTVSGTAHSPWSPRQVASGVLLGAWSGSASCCLGLAEGEASLIRSTFQNV